MDDKHFNLAHFFAWAAALMPSNLQGYITLFASMVSAVVLTGQFYLNYPKYIST